MKKSISMHWLEPFAMIRTLLCALACLAVPAAWAEPDLDGFRSDLKPVAVSVMPRPGLHKPVIEPDFGARLMRITDATQIKGVERVRQYYAKRNPFNADQSLAILIASDGINWLYDTQSWTPVKRIPVSSSDAELHWHPTDPRRLLALDFGSGYNLSRLFWVDVETGNKTLLADLEKSGFVSASGLMEGNPDKALSRYAVAGKTRSGGFALALIDLASGKLLHRRSVEEEWITDWVSVSPSGKYVVAMGKSRTRIFNDKLELLRTLPEGSYGHGDLCMAADGREVLVFDGADYQLNGNRNINIAWLETGEMQIGTRIGWSATPHVSCRNLAFPGWALVSTQGAAGRRNDYPNLDFEIFWLKLDGSGEVRRIAHHRSSREKGGYFAEQHAVTSQDGTRIIFASNWGEDEVDAFLLTLPAR